MGFVFPNKSSPHNLPVKYGVRPANVNQIIMHWRASVKFPQSMNDHTNLLFLCTGNYYRSRFAEILFNWLATEAGLHCRATSRGLATEGITPEYGPISPLAANRLRERGYQLEAPIRFPLQLSEQDLLHAQRVIALDEQEHRPLIERRYPGWASRIEYWQIPDLNHLPANRALANIEKEVEELLRQYRTA